MRANICWRDNEGIGNKCASEWGSEVTESGGKTAIMAGQEVRCKLMMHIFDNV